MENYEQKQIVLFRKYAFGGVTKQDMLLTEGYNIEGFLLRKSSFRECYKTSYVTTLTLLGPMLIKINTLLANFNNTRPSLILNN